MGRGSRAWSSIPRGRRVRSALPIPWREGELSDPGGVRAPPDARAGKVHAGGLWGAGAPAPNCGSPWGLATPLEGDLVKASPHDRGGASGAPAARFLSRRFSALVGLLLSVSFSPFFSALFPPSELRIPPVRPSPLPRCPPWLRSPLSGTRFLPPSNRPR